MVKGCYLTSLRSFRMACSLGMCSSVWIWMVSVSLLNFGQFLEKCYEVIEFDLGTGAIIFAISLVDVPRTRHYCFTASVHCVLIFKTFIASQWSFLIYVSLSFFFLLPRLIFLLCGCFFLSQ